MTAALVRDNLALLPLIALTITTAGIIFWFTGTLLGTYLLNHHGRNTPCPPPDAAPSTATTAATTTHDAPTTPAAARPSGPAS